MGLKGWNVAVLLAIGVIWFAGSTQREKRVVGDSHTDRVALLEEQVAASPNDVARVRELAQAYLDARAPGMALASIEHATPAVRAEPTVEHLYARALLEQLVTLGVEDANAHPEASSLAYHNATRQVSFSSR